MSNFSKEEVIRFLDLLKHEKQTEVRVIDIKLNKVSNYFFDKRSELIKFIEENDGKYNLYVGLNERILNGTKANEVISVRNIFLDLDCVNKPAKEEDIKKVTEIGVKIVEDLEKRFNTKPSIIMSGNGIQLIYPIPKIEIDGKNYKIIEGKIQAFQKEIIDKYSNNEYRLDNVGDLPRIIRVTGAINVKGGRRANFLEYNDKESEKLKDYILNLNPKNIDRVRVEKIIQEKVDKKFIEDNILPNISSFIKNLIIKEKTKEELNKLGFPSRSERDAKIISHLLNKGFGKYIFSIFNKYECGDKYSEHSSGDVYLSKTIETSAKFLKLRNPKDMELEEEIESMHEVWLKRSIDDYLKRISEVEDDSNLFKERLLAVLAFRVKIKQTKLEKRIEELNELSQTKEVTNLFEINEKDFVEQEFWLDPLLPKGTIIMLGSKPGEGKSLLIQALFTSIMTTNQFIGYVGSEKPKVLLYSIDDSSENILKSRNHYILNGLKNIPTFNIEGLKNINITYQFNRNNLYTEIKEAMKYDIIIVDSYRRVLKGAENDSEVTNQFFNDYLKPLKEAGKTIILLHHMKKGNLDELEMEDFLDGFRGSSDITSQLDLGYALKGISNLSQDENNDIKDIVLAVCKNRLGLNFKTLENKFTKKICYRVTKNITNKETTFDYLEPELVLSPKERRFELIINIVNELKESSRETIVEKVRKITQISKIQIYKDLEELVKNFSIIRIKKGIYGPFILPEEVKLEENLNI